MDAFMTFALVVMGLAFAAAPEYATAQSVTVSKGKSKSVSQTAPDSNLVDVDFPEPTSIQDVTRFMSLKLGMNFVLPPNANERIQIVAPEPMTPDDAFKAYVSAVEMAGYKVSRAGKVFKLERAAGN